MAKYRQNLPQLANRTFLSDGGMETTLIFLEGIDLPHFASFTLMATPEGRQQLKKYYARKYLTIARRSSDTASSSIRRPGALTPTGESCSATVPEALRAVNEDSIALLLELRREFETSETPCVISGAIGPRGDGYRAGRMEAEEAQAYHAAQIESFARTEADMVAAYTMNTVEEAIGIASAAKAARMPCMISFTVETDGRLATGMALGEAIGRRRRRDGRLAGLLHDQLRASDAFHAGADEGREMARPRLWREGQRLGQEPCRTG